MYAYAGYPLVLALLARMRPARGWSASEPPSITLLIAAYNEEDVIEKKLLNSLELGYPRDKLQILVASDGSDDRTVEIVRSFADRGIELSHCPERRGKMAAINRGISRARGEIVVFSDANNMYSRDALRELTAPFSDRSVGAVSGAKSIIRGDDPLGESEGLYWRYESFIKEQETRLGTCTGVCGEILAIRRSLFEQPPESVINDDFYIGMRIIKRGGRIVYAPGARSFERASLSGEDEMTRRARIVAGRFQAMFMARRLLPADPVVAWQVISHKFLRPLVPLAMIGALAANVVAVIRPYEGADQGLLHLSPPFGAAVLACQALFYGVALLPRAGLRLGGGIGKLLYLPSFLVDSNVAALLGLFRFASGRQSPLWERVRRA